MGSQVAVAEVAVVPTFKGFRRLTTQETDGAAKAGAQGFAKAFAKTGTDSGKQVGVGFKKAFEQSADGASSKVTKQLEGDVAKASRALSTARMKEQDSIGKVRLAQAQLNEANGKYAADSSQVIRAQERLATASRQLENAHEGTEKATDDLKRSQGELARAADHAGDELAEAGNRGVTGFRSNVIGGVKSFALPLIGAFAALGIGNIVVDAFSQAKDFISGSIDIASDLNESANAVSVAYGDAADEVLKLGENSAKAFGLSKGDLNAYATQFSAFVKTIAGEGGDVAGTLEQLVGRGTDFASVFNLEVSDALQLFQSGLAGETEPLRKYGIDLSATAVEAYALSSGLVQASVDSRKVELAQNTLTRATDDFSAAVRDYGEESEQAAKARDAVTRAELGLESAMSGSNIEMTEAQKQQARYAYLLEQTSAVQGDFANTSDELANKNRINAAAWENIQAKIGDGFLPIAQELAGIVGDDLLPVIAKLAEEQGPALAEAFADVLPELAELAEELLPQIPGLLTSFTDALPGLIGLLQFLAPLLITITEGGNDQIGAFSSLFDLLSGDTSLVDFGNEMLGLAGPIGDVTRWGTGLMNSFIGWFSTIVANTSNGVNNVIAIISALPAQASQALGNLGNLLVQSGKDLMSGFLKGIEAMTKPIGDAVTGVLDWVGGFFPHSPAKRGPFSGSGWTQLQRSGAAFWDQWVGGMGDDGPVFPSFPGGGPGSPALPGGSSSSPAVAPRTVNQYIYPQQTDPRLQMRQWGREAERAFASS